MRGDRSKPAGLATAVLLLVLAGCAGWKKPVPVAIGTQEDRLALSHWRMEGRIAVRTSQDAFQANLQWEHERKQDRVQVSGPFSQGAYSIVLQDDLIFIRDSSGNSRSSRNIPELLQQELGFAVPLSSLRYWVLGIPEPSESPRYVLYDEAGVLRRLRQHDWMLDFQSFVQVRDFLLPQKVAAQGRDIRLKLFVDDWVIVQ